MPIVYTTAVFSSSKTETFENTADPVLVWVVFQCKWTKTETFENTADPVLVWVMFKCKWTKTETFENDGVAAHIHSAYPWRLCKQ